MKKYLAMSFLPVLAFASNNIEVGFSTDKTSLPLVIKAINSAKKSICMAAYSFTSKPISEALLNADKRGVKVKIVADAKSNQGRYTATTFLANHGVNINLNDKYAIMHNKFIVIDNQTVETGSFNYSAAAVKKNAENVIVIWNNPDIANQYTKQCDYLCSQGYKLAKSY